MKDGCTNIYLGSVFHGVDSYRDTRAGAFNIHWIDFRDASGFDIDNGRGPVDWTYV